MNFRSKLANIKDKLANCFISPVLTKVFINHLYLHKKFIKISPLQETHLGARFLNLRTQSMRIKIVCFTIRAKSERIDKFHGLVECLAPYTKATLRWSSVDIACFI